jgi:phospholipid transport system substrate-binding protein
MKRTTLAALLLSLAMHGVSAHAALPPESVIASMTERVLGEAKTFNGTADAAKIRALVETVILPNIDLAAMTSRAVGVKWRSATDAQKAQLMSAFQAVLVKTYAGAFSQAQRAQFKIQRVVALDPQTTEVRAEVVAAGGSEPIPIVCRMVLELDSWKVVDLSVSGVWLVPTYHSQFAQVLQNGDVDSLIRVLQEKLGSH